jgi:dihydrofolate reductase
MNTPFELEAIMAIADNGAFGIHQGLPWHIPSELQYFKSITMNYPMIMGYNTFKSLGNILPGRDHIVITSKKIPTQEALYIVDSFSEACSIVQTLDSKKAFIIGGATLFADTLHFCSLVHVSRIHIEPQADIFFTFPVDNWHCIHESDTIVDPKTAISYTIQKWKKGKEL